MAKYSVGIVDDNMKLAEQVAEKLLLTEEVEVQFMAHCGHDALKWLASHKKHPDILLMDIEMPDMNGIETTFKIKSIYTSTRIIMLTVFDNEERIVQAIQAGADGYLLKEETAGRMLAAFAEVFSGGAPMSQEVAKKTFKMLATGYDSASKSPLYTAEQTELSKREIEILALMAKGMNNAQIAQQLYISPATVKKHIENIYGKLHLKSRINLVLWYKQFV